MGDTRAILDRLPAILAVKLGATYHGTGIDIRDTDYTVSAGAAPGLPGDKSLVSAKTARLLDMPLEELAEDRVKRMEFVVALRNAIRAVVQSLGPPDCERVNADLQILFQGDELLRNGIADLIASLLARDIALEIGVEGADDLPEPRLIYQTPGEIVKALVSVVASLSGRPPGDLVREMATGGSAAGARRVLALAVAHAVGCDEASDMGRLVVVPAIERQLDPILAVGNSLWRGDVSLPESIEYGRAVAHELRGRLRATMAILGADVAAPAMRLGVEPQRIIRPLPHLTPVNVDSVESFYAVARDMVSQLLQCPSSGSSILLRGNGVVYDGTMEIAHPQRRGDYTYDVREARLHQRLVRAPLEQFFTARIPSSDLRSAIEEEASPVRVRSAINTVAHEFTHATRPDDPVCQEADEYFWAPGSRVVDEGIAEAVAHVLTPLIAEAMGMFDKDPRLVSAEIEPSYEGEAAAMTTIATAIAQSMGCSPTDELILLGSSGKALMPLEIMSGQIATLRGLDTSTQEVQVTAVPAAVYALLNRLAAFEASLVTLPEELRTEEGERAGKEAYEMASAAVELAMASVDHGQAVA